METEARKLSQYQEKLEDKLSRLEDKSIYRAYLKYKEFKTDYEIAIDKRFEDVSYSTSVIKLMTLRKEYIKNGIKVDNLEASKNRVLKYQKYVQLISNMDLTDITEEKTRSVVYGIISRENTDEDIAPEMMKYISVIENFEMGDAILETIRGDAEPSVAVNRRNLDAKDFIKASQKVREQSQNPAVEIFCNNYYNLHNQTQAPNIVLITSAINNIEINETYQILQNLGVVERDKSRYKVITNENNVKNFEQNDDAKRIDITTSKLREDLETKKAIEEANRKKAEYLFKLNKEKSPYINDDMQQDELDETFEKGFIITKSEYDIRKAIRKEHEDRNKEEIVQRIANMTKEDAEKVEKDIQFIGSETSKEDDDQER